MLTRSQSLHCVRDVVSSYAGHITDISGCSEQRGNGVIQSTTELLPSLAEHQHWQELSPVEPNSLAHQANQGLNPMHHIMMNNFGNQDDVLIFLHKMGRQPYAVTNWNRRCLSPSRSKTKHKKTLAWLQLSRTLWSGCFQVPHTQMESVRSIHSALHVARTSSGSFILRLGKVILPSVHRLSAHKLLPVYSQEEGLYLLLGEACRWQEAMTVCHHITLLFTLWHRNFCLFYHRLSSSSQPFLPRWLLVFSLSAQAIESVSRLPQSD